MDPPEEQLRFAEYELDLSRFELRRNGTPVPVERQVFDLLVYLARAEGRVVTKEELLDNVWGTRFVTESALTTQIKFARRALGDDGMRQRFIRTVHRRGYEFVATPRDAAAPSPGSSSGSGPAGSAVARPSSHQAASRLVGREGSVADLAERLSERRLVTVVGPGGVGKTQLALAVAAMVGEQFDDGVVKVDLTPLTDPGEIPRVVAEAAGIGRREGAAVADALAEARAIVLMDNCEHLVDGVAEFVERLLARPGDPSRVLATSREPLAIVDEFVFTLEPLPTRGVAGQLSPAARLFIERSGRSDLDTVAVEQLVAVLDGLPLAIELAASQLGFMSLTELQRLLEQHRLVLEGSRRRRSRHDSLADNVEWSWDLLDEDERRLLTELSIFPGDFGLDAVERIGSGPAPISLLRRLHAKSLVASARSVDTTRFRLLFGVRDFVRPHQERLDGGVIELRHRLARSFAEWVDEWIFEEQWTSTEFLDVVLAERATLREIVAVGDAETVVDVARVAATEAIAYRYGIGVSQGRTIARRIDLEALPADVAARLALAGSEACYAFGDVASKDELAAIALEYATAAARPDLVATALAQQCVGRMLVDADRCATLLDRAVEQAQIGGHQRIESIALGLQGFCSIVRGTLDDAEQLVELSEQRAAASGWDRISVTTVRGLARFLRNDHLGAASEYASLAGSMEALGLSGAAALFGILDVTCRAGTATADEIRTTARTFMSEFQRATGHAGHADALLVLAHRAVCAGDEKRAAVLLEALRGRRLAHQVSMLIMNDVAVRSGLEPVDFAVPSVRSPQSIPEMGDLVEQELAAVV